MISPNIFAKMAGLPLLFTATKNSKTHFSADTFIAHLCNRRERDWVLGEFKAGNSPILIATDVASRGLGMFFIYKQALLPLAECHKSRRASPSFWFACLVKTVVGGRCGAYSSYRSLGSYLEKDRPSKMCAYCDVGVLPGLCQSLPLTCALTRRNCVRPCVRVVIGPHCISETVAYLVLTSNGYGLEQRISRIQQFASPLAK